MWFHKDAIANIFGFGDLVHQYQITYDSAKEDAFLVHMKHKIVKFTWTTDRLSQFKVPYAYKDALKVKEKEMTETSNMVQTSMTTRLFIPRRQVEQAKVA